MIPSMPPKSFWFLARSVNMNSLSIRDQHRDQRLETNRWHLLPGEWRQAAEEACRIAQQNAGTYSHYSVEIFDPQISAPAEIKKE
jgi:hypothetical protein